jgi:geranylgeranyl reductase family protein
MGRPHAVPGFDAVIVGAGPAGSTAALSLARAGARVALVDRRGFPRDKACGDLVGPRGVRLLQELGIAAADSRAVGDMVVVGPSGRRALLPTTPGRDYPGHALAISRLVFDQLLFESAVAAGAHPVRDLFVDLAGDRHAPDGVRLSAGGELRADVVVGADGATSRVAAAAGLVDAGSALWGFAMRSYLDAPVELPHILLWEPEPWQLFPGYGWLFPTADGRANVGLGLAVGPNRLLARQAGERFDDFCAHLRRLGLLPADAGGPAGGGTRLGGWLKMGAVGTVSARGRVLLVGDAAGLINPLQGEGIAQAMASGRAAAAAILAGRPSDAARRYRDALGALTGHQRINAPVQRGIVRHPRAVSLAGRVLTAPVLRTALGGAWALYWNDLVDGATPGARRRMAAGTTRVVAALGSRTATGKWFAQAS